MKIFAGDIIILLAYQKSQSYDVLFLRHEFVILGHFLPFYPLNDPENQNFAKMNKMPGDIVILHVYHKWRSYHIWFLKYKARQTEFFVILGHFLPFHPRDNPENQHFEKIKKKPGDIIILDNTKNHDHMLHCSWDTARNGCNFYFSFWAIFCPFIPLTTQKIKIKKKWKKKKKKKNTWRYQYFTGVYQKLWSHDVQFLRYVARRTDGRTDGRTEKVTYKGGCST